MVERADIITKTRDDLIEICELLMDAVPPELITNPEKPVVITINGSWHSGKKLIFDASKNFLLKDSIADNTVEFEGQVNAEELYIGKRDGNILQVSFNNPMYAGSPSELKHGGVQFSSNMNIYKNYEDYKPAWINIWLESELRPIEDDDYRRRSIMYSRDISPSRIEKLDRGTRKLFNDLSYQNQDPAEDWVRLLEITVKNKKLLESDYFQSKVEKLPFRKIPDINNRHVSYLFRLCSFLNPEKIFLSSDSLRKKYSPIYGDDITPN